MDQRKNGGYCMERVRTVDRGAKNRLMAQMNAVEVADGQDARVP